MLHETRHVAQVSGEPFRRCFVDDKLDLVIWYGPDQSIHGFQLSYDPEGSPRVMTWTPTRGFVHASIDGGEESPLVNRSPVLVPCDEYDAAQLLASFRAAALELPAAEKAFVEARLIASAGCR